MLSSEHKRGNLLCLILLQRRDGVGVGIERNRDGGMPQPFRDDFGMDAGCETRRFRARPRPHLTRVRRRGIRAFVLPPTMKLLGDWNLYVIIYQTSVSCWGGAGDESLTPDPMLESHLGLSAVARTGCAGPTANPASTRQPLTGRRHRPRSPSRHPLTSRSNRDSSPVARESGREVSHLLVRRRRRRRRAPA